MDTGRAKRLLRPGLILRCPDCGLGSLYRSMFRMHTYCEYCGLIYEREQGYCVDYILNPRERRIKHVDFESE